VEARKKIPPKPQKNDAALPAPKKTEPFAPYFAGTSRMNLVAPTDLTPYVLWGVSVLAILFVVIKKL
jgi:hypothetical protein